MPAPTIFRQMSPSVPQLETWIKTTPAGLYCEPGGFHIDPLLPVQRAIVTHGHSDHARPGNERVLATPGTIAIMQSRYGELAGGSLQPLDYGEPIAIDGVGARRIPAGHVLGSAQVVLDYRAARRARRLQAPGGPDLGPLRAVQLRSLHHGGYLRIAGLPPSARPDRDRQAAAFAIAFSRPLSRRRGLCARQMPAGSGAVAARGIRGADLSARRADRPDRAL